MRSAFAVGSEVGSPHVPVSGVGRLHRADAVARQQREVRAQGDRVGVVLAQQGLAVGRRAFQLGEVGMAAAVGITLMVLIFGINLVVNRVGDRTT